MAFMDVKAVYRAVIDEVTTKSRPEFVQADVDEAVLDELRVLWEEKLRASDVLGPPKPPRVKQEAGYGHAQYPGTPGYQYGIVQSAVNAQNFGRPVSYLPAQTLAWQRTTAGAPGHTVQTGQAAPAQQHAASQPHLQVSHQPGYQIVQTQMQVPSYQQRQPVAQGQVYAQTSAPQTAVPAAHRGYTQQAYAPQAQTGNPTPVWNPSSQAPSARPVQPVSTPYLAQQGGQAYYAYAQNTRPMAQTAVSVQQNPAVSQVQTGQAQQLLLQQAHASQQAALADASRKRGPEEDAEASYRAKMQILNQQYASGQNNHPQQPRLPQQDGPSDGGDESDKGEDDNEKEDSPEKEELENFSDVASSNEEEDNFPNTCISQFVKVQRTKTKWRCQLKGGILHLNERDYVFGTAHGDFQF